MLFIIQKLLSEENMINLRLFTENDEERMRQLSGIANLHISIAKEIMSGEKPLSTEEMESLLELLITANEAKHLAQKIKTTVERKETA